VKANLPLNLFEAATETELSARPPQIDVDGRKNNSRKRRAKEPQIEACAIKGHND